MTTNVSKVKNIIRLRRAVECLAEQKNAKPPEPLFDRFWAEGELALLFGASGTGKSFLAVQIADAIARGTPMTGFDMTKGRKKVLYVDLAMSDAQFHARYGSYQMARNLFRGRPDDDEDLFEWIAAAVEQHDLRAVVVDDLSTAATSHFGIRQTVRLMRNLQRLCHRTGVSVLAISDSFSPRNHWESEDDLGDSRVICRFADSVFSLAKLNYRRHNARLVQIKTRSGELFWKHTNAPECSIKRLESGLMGFEFDDRFAPVIDEARAELIRRVHWLHEDGSSFAAIGKELGISKTLAHKLCRKWTPALGGEPEKPAFDPSFYDDPEPQYGDEAEAWMSIEREKALGVSSDEIDVDVGDGDVDVGVGVGEDVAEVRTIYDLEQDSDGYGGTIYVESRDPYTGKPAVWYKPDRNGIIYRSTRRYGTVFRDEVGANAECGIRPRSEFHL
jgi:KaiC/GvpD/RAD55 family RecA-like ATPase